MQQRKFSTHGSDELAFPLDKFYGDGDLSSAIASCRLAEPKIASQHFHLSLLQFKAGSEALAKETLKKALALANQTDLAYLQHWSQFYLDYHCEELAFLTYHFAITENDKARVSFLSSAPRQEFKPEDYGHVVNLALRCGRPKEAEAYSIRANKYKASANPKVLLALGKVTQAEQILYSSDEEHVLGYLVAKNPKDDDWQSLREIHADNIGLVSQIAYLFAIEHLKEKHAQIRELSGLFNNAKLDANCRALAGIALCHLDQTYLADYMIFVNQKYKNFILYQHNHTEIIVFLLAYRALYHITKEEEYKSKIQHSLHLVTTKNLPLSIPFYLRPAYLDLLLDKHFWPTTTIDKDAVYDLPEIKEQIVVLLESTGIDFITRLNLAVQALCSQTTVGRIIDVAQNTLHKTNICRSTKLKIVQFIKSYATEQHIRDLSDDTCDALWKTLKNDPSLLETLEAEKYYSVAKFLKDAAHLQTCYVTVADAPHTKINPADTHLIQALEKMTQLAKEGESFKASSALSDTLNCTTDLQVIANIGDFFFQREYFALALQAYSRVNSSLSNKQARQASLAAYHLGNIPEAINLAQRLQKPNLSNCAKRSFRRRLEKPHHANQLPSIRRNLSVEWDEKTIAHHFSQDDGGNQDSLDYQYLMCLYATQPQWQIFFGSHERLESANLTTPASKAMAFNARLHFAYQQIHTTDSKKIISACDMLAQNDHTFNQSAIARFFRMKCYLQLNHQEFALSELDAMSDAEGTLDESTTFKLMKSIYQIRLSRVIPHELINLVKKYDAATNLSIGVNLALSVAYQTLGDSEKLLCMLNNSNIAPHVLPLASIPIYLKQDYIQLLTNPRNWHLIIYPHKHVDHYILESYVHETLLTQNLELGIQALCPNTLVGKLFCHAPKQTMLNAINTMLNTQNTLTVTLETKNSFLSVLRDNKELDLSKFGALSAWLEHHKQTPSRPRP